ncbi:MAG: hypothetical protein U1E67_11055 [Hyphomicrobiales bacterium]
MNRYTMSTLIKVLSLLCCTAFLFVAPVVSAGRHAAPDIEALLPQSLGGVSLTVESQAGTELSTNSSAFDTFLKTLGKTRADFSLASAYAPGGLKGAAGIWRVNGADPAQLIAAFKAALQASSNVPLTIVEETIAGHPVTRIGAPGELAQGPLYAFAKSNMILFVQTPDPALAEEAIGKLWQ